MFLRKLKKLFEKTFSTSIGKTLEVDAPIADVYISSWNKEEVNVKITGDNDAKEEIEFTIEETPDGIRVKGEKRAGFSWDKIFSSLDLNIEVKVPSEYSTDIKTSGGDVKLDTVEGKNIIKTSGGDIKCRKVEGELSVKTSGGDIELEAAQGKVSAKTSGGDVMLEYHGENMGIVLSTSGGDIVLKLPENFEADLKLRSWGGDIETELSHTSVQEVSSDKYNGKINGGGKLVECTTSGGDVVVKSR